MNFDMNTFATTEAANTAYIDHPKPDTAYVVQITGVNDNAGRECLEVVYDIAEGKFAGHWSDDWGDKHEYAHMLKQYYGAKSMARWRYFIEVLAASNPKFDMQGWLHTCDEHQLIGLKFGLYLQGVEATSRAGSTYTQLKPTLIMTVDEAREYEKAPQVESVPSQQPVTQTKPTNDDLAGETPTSEIPFDFSQIKFEKVGANRI